MEMFHCLGLASRQRALDNFGIHGWESVGFGRLKAMLMDLDGAVYNAL